MIRESRSWHGSFPGDVEGPGFSSLAALLSLGFARMAMTQNDRLGGLNCGNVFSHSFKGLTYEIKVLTVEVVLLRAVRGLCPILLGPVSPRQKA